MQQRTVNATVHCTSNLERAFGVSARRANYYVARMLNALSFPRRTLLLLRQAFAFFHRFRSPSFLTPNEIPSPAALAIDDHPVLVRLYTFNSLEYTTRATSSWKQFFSLASATLSLFLRSRRVSDSLIYHWFEFHDRTTRGSYAATVLVRPCC